MPEIIISLTTTSFRINKVHLTIQSLLRQKTILDFSIRLYISRKTYAIDNGIKKIPKQLQYLVNNKKRFRIFYTDNIGSYRKLIPIIKEKINTDCLIVTVDDDKIYANNFIKRLVDNYYKYNEKYIIAYRGCLRVNKYLLAHLQKDTHLNVKTKKFLLKCAQDKDKSRDIASNLGKHFEIVSKLIFFSGNDGVLYHPKFFNKTVYNIDLIKRIAKNHDDVWFKLNSLYNNIGVIVINHNDRRSSKQIGNTHKFGLHHNINKGSYEKHILEMSKLFFGEN